MFGMNGQNLGDIEADIAEFGADLDGSYGTNGFKLEFKDSADLAADTSGNSKSITATNIAAADQQWQHAHA